MNNEQPGNAKMYDENSRERRQLGPRHCSGTELVTLEEEDRCVRVQHGEKGGS